MSTPLPHPTSPAGVANYLVPSIILTVASFIVCCLSCISLPGIATGIVAIVFGSKVNKLLGLGDEAGAQQASRTAKIWMWVTAAFLGLGALVFIGSLLFMGTDGYMMQIEEFRRQLEAR